MFGNIELSGPTSLFIYLLINIFSDRKLCPLALFTPLLECIQSYLRERRGENRARRFNCQSGKPNMLITVHEYFATNQNICLIHIEINQKFQITFHILYVKAHSKGIQN